MNQIIGTLGPQAEAGHGERRVNEGDTETNTDHTSLLLLHSKKDTARGPRHCEERKWKGAPQGPWFSNQVRRQTPPEGRCCLCV